MRPSSATTHRTSASSLLDQIVPRCDFVERHAIRVEAPPERALAAAKEVKLAELPVVRLLFRLRGMATPPRVSLYEAMRKTGFDELADEPGREVVAGAVGRPWRPRDRLKRGVDFRAFDEPGYAKMALNFLAAGDMLSTETRVVLTDESARRSFRRYWLLIRPFSGLIRVLWLRAAKRRAENS